MRPRSFAGVSAVLAVLVACGAEGCGHGDALVGGACAAGYAQCENTCVDLSSDPANCGVCGATCALGVACFAGSCAASGHEGGGQYDGGGQSDGGDAAGKLDGAASDASDAPAADAAPGDALTADAPGLDALATDALTDANAPNCADAVLGDDSSTRGCTAPLQLCGCSCVDVSANPDNCGTCNNACASNLCSGGVCQGAAPGDDIVIGHDYLGVSATTAEARVLANAALLRYGNPVRILSYERYADSATVASTKAILSSAAAARGRTVAITVAPSDTYVEDNLTVRNFDVLLVHDQADAGADTLSSLGSAWASSLATYFATGGEVVSLDGAKGNGQMPIFLTQSNLLAVTSQMVKPSGTAFTVAAPGDSVGTGVLSPYGTLGQNAEMTTDPAGASNVYVVVDPADGAPVVIHKLVP